MSAKAFADGVASLLANDVTFTAALALLLGIGSGVLPVMRANTPLALIPAANIPGWVLEQGDGVTESITEGSDAFLTIGNYEQHFASELVVVLLWKQDDREAASNVRASLPLLLAQLFLRNPQPGGIAGAWLSDWQPDRAANHPNQIWQATIRGQYAIPRS